MSSMLSPFRRFIFATLLVITLTGLVSTTASAYDPFKQACSTGGTSSAVCADDDGGDPIGGDNGIVNAVVNVIAVVGGAVATIVIVVAGIRYIGSDGDGEQIAQSKRAIIYAIVGLIAIALARTVIFFVLSKV